MRCSKRCQRGKECVGEESTVGILIMLPSNAPAAPGRWVCRAPHLRVGQPTQRPACLGTLMRKERPLGQSIQQAIQLICRQSCVGVFLLLLATGSLHSSRRTNLCLNIETLNTLRHETSAIYTRHEDESAPTQAFRRLCARGLYGCTRLRRVFMGDRSDVLDVHLDISR